MSIVDYASLQASVLNWLHRTGDADLTAIVPDAIMLAEKRMNADLDAREMDVQTNISIASGNDYASIPSDLLESRRLIITSETPNSILKYVSPDALKESWPDPSLTGQPRLFTVIGNQIQVAPMPDKAYTAQLTYRQALPALSNANTTNWLLTKYPNAYFYGTLVALQPWLAADERMPMFEMLYQQSIAVVNSIDWYSGTTLRVRPN